MNDGIKINKLPEKESLESTDIIISEDKDGITYKTPVKALDIRSIIWSLIM